MNVLIPETASRRSKGENIMGKKRCDVPEKYRWDLSVIFATDDDFKKECDELEKEIDFSAFRGTLKDAEHVLAFLRRQDELSKRLEKAYCYAMMRFAAASASTPFSDRSHAATEVETVHSSPIFTRA